MNFFTCLFIVFLVLKLVGIISWSWWIVTSPLWGGIAFSLIALCFTSLVLAISVMIKK